MRHSTLLHGNDQSSQEKTDPSDRDAIFRVSSDSICQTNPNDVIVRVPIDPVEITEASNASYCLYKTKQLTRTIQPNTSQKKK